MEDMLLRVLGLQLVEDDLKVADGAAAGLGQGAGTLEKSVDIVNGKGAVVAGFIAEGHVHRNGPDAVFFRQFSRNVRSGLCQQDKFAHVCTLSSSKNHFKNRRISQSFTF